MGWCRSRSDRVGDLGVVGAEVLGGGRGRGLWGGREPEVVEWGI